MPRDPNEDYRQALRLYHAGVAEERDKISPERRAQMSAAREAKDRQRRAEVKKFIGTLPPPPESRMERPRKFGPNKTEYRKGWKVTEDEGHVSNRTGILIKTITILTPDGRIEEFYSTTREGPPYRLMGSSPDPPDKAVEQNVRWRLGKNS